MDAKIYLPYFLIIVLAITIGIVYIDKNEVDVDLTDYATSDWVKEWVNWKLDNEVHPNIQELNSTTLKIYQDKDLNREAIAELRLFVLRELKEAETVPSTSPTFPSPFTPLLTLTISKTEWGLGQTLIFSGSGTPGSTVLLTVVKSGGCGQNDICSDWAKIDNNGSYRIDFPTKFDDIPGTWQAYVRVGKIQSDTITFEII